MHDKSPDSGMHVHSPCTPCHRHCTCTRDPEIGSQPLRVCTCTCACQSDKQTATACTYSGVSRACKWQGHFYSCKSGRLNGTLCCCAACTVVCGSPADGGIVVTAALMLFVVGSTAPRCLIETRTGVRVCLLAAVASFGREIVANAPMAPERALFCWGNQPN